MIPDPGPTPPPLPLPPIPGEITPSPPVSPSPAPPAKKRHTTSRVNQILDANISNQFPLIPNTENATNTPHALMATPPTAHTTANSLVQTTIAPTMTSDDSMPQLEKITEAVSLRFQTKPRRAPTRDPLDKYTKGVTLTIHDAHPGAAYELVNTVTYNKWKGHTGEKLLAIPFENEQRSLDTLEDISNRIFSAAVEITGSKKLGVSAPIIPPKVKNEEEQEDEPIPNTFLIYGLSNVHQQILTQQTVWASQNITFRITTPELKCPTFLFAIKGLRTMEPEVVREIVKDIWNDEITTDFIKNGISNMEESERNNAARAIKAFMDSITVKRLDILGKGATPMPNFNVHADGSIINDTVTWNNIRNHLAERKYHNSSFGQGKVIIAPYNCALCHGVDHPRGMCPFPSLKGWKGPKKRQPLNNQKKGPN